MKHIRLLLVVLVIVIFVSLNIFAQSGRVTGKIDGIISDQDNGEPLIGVNIILANSNIGATTDVDGYYLILNVPAGTYTVEYSYVGYSTKRFSDVVVSPDRTTRINLKLEVQAVQGEVVEVVADKPVIQRDQTYRCASAKVKFG